MSTSDPLPRALRLVALLFLLQGIWAVITVVVCAFHNRIQVDFDVLDLFVYFGLLRLSSGWRTCALFLIYLTLILLPIVTFISLATPHVNANINILGMPGAAIPPFFVALASIICFGIALMQWSVLKRPDVEALFEQRRLAGHLR